MTIAVDTREALAEFLVRELNERGWTQAELARRIDRPRQTISNYAMGKVATPDEGVLRDIARVFGIPPEKIYRIAGLLPVFSETNPERDELVHLWELLSPVDQIEALDFLRFKAGVPRPAVPLIYNIFNNLSKQPRRGFLALVQDPNEITSIFPADRFHYVQHAQIPGQGLIIEVIDDDEGDISQHE